MQFKKSTTIAFLSTVLLFSTGCDSLNSLSGATGDKKLTRAEVKRMIKDSESELPLSIDEHFTLTKFTLDYGGTLNGWCTVSDELTAKLRKIGNVKIEEAMRENLTKLDLEKSDVPEQVIELIEQEEFAIQYILEDKYGLPIASIVVSKETLEGDVRVGRTQQNPFAVRNVSKNANQ